MRRHRCRGSLDLSNAAVRDEINKARRERAAERGQGTEEETSNRRGGTSKKSESVHEIDLFCN